MLSRCERHGVRLASSVTLRQEWIWQVRSSGLPLTQWQAEQSLVVSELGCRRHTSVHGGFQKNFTFFAASHVAVFALGNMVIWPSLPLSGCCLWSIGYWIRGEMLLLRRLLEEFHTFSLARWTRIVKHLGLHACAEWRSVFGRCFSLQSLFCVARTWKSKHFVYEVNESGSECDDGSHFCCSESLLSGCAN